MAHSGADIINLTEDEGFDQDQLNLAIEASLARPNWMQQGSKYPSLPSVEDEDQELQRALAESMRTFEEEQQGTSSHMAGRKRSSSPEAHLVQQQQQPNQQQNTTAGGASSKRQRGSGLLSGTAADTGIAGQPQVAQDPLAQQQQHGSMEPCPNTANHQPSLQCMHTCEPPQQQLAGLGRSGSVQHMQDVDGLEKARLHGSGLQGGSSALGNTSSSSSSIAHGSGLPHAVTPWASVLARAQSGPLLSGPQPMPGRPGDWRIYNRQHYPGQLVWWTGQWCCSGRVLTVEGDGSRERPALYTVELDSHPTLRYVEASPHQLLPRLKLGDKVWCKPAMAKPAQWSAPGPYEARLRVNTSHPFAALQPRHPQAADWMLGHVVGYQVHDTTPVVEVQLQGYEDRCWFAIHHLDLVWEIGESSSTAQARSRGAQGQGQQQAATASQAEQQQQQQQLPQQQGQRLSPDKTDDLLSPAVSPLPQELEAGAPGDCPAVDQPDAATAIAAAMLAATEVATAALLAEHAVALPPQDAAARQPPSPEPQAGDEAAAAAAEVVADAVGAAASMSTEPLPSSPVCEPEAMQHSGGEAAVASNGAPQQPSCCAAALEGTGENADQLAQEVVVDSCAAQQEVQQQQQSGQEADVSPPQQQQQQAGGKQQCDQQGMGGQRALQEGFGET